ncbi:hypothetical protein LX64_04306 [Chitinophaga skermanii]|uniref:Uncharacterized protein n=1 Tax=Chitinophaga skermanii TaxID=331697 RepID=A0A327Q7B0_9BACT|nr:hypothetical protein [Chitinophaga skermanii]RAI99753.1 hypothetical protein LX64_04306 [Chitinophaga skermanii]
MFKFLFSKKRKFLKESDENVYTYPIGADAMPTVAYEAKKYTNVFTIKPKYYKLKNKRAGHHLAAF